MIIFPIIFTGCVCIAFEVVLSQTARHVALRSEYTVCTKEYSAWVNISILILLRLHTTAK